MSMYTAKAAAFAALLSSAATGAWAVEYGTVVSSTPVVSNVPVAQRQCQDEVISAPQRSTGGGALVGALIGAAVGNAFGGGSGRAVATGIGMIAGAAIGDHAEADASPQGSTTTQRCRNVTHYEQRTVAYDVVYDYQGVRRSVRLAQDPGDRIALDVQVVPAGAPAPVRGASPPAARAPVYRSPVDSPYVDGAPPLEDYAPTPAYPPAQVVYANPWPYVLIGGALIGATQVRGWRGHGYRHHR